VGSFFFGGRPRRFGPEAIASVAFFFCAAVAADFLPVEGPIFWGHDDGIGDGDDDLLTCD